MMSKFHAVSSSGMFSYFITAAVTYVTCTELTHKDNQPNITQ